LAGELCRDLLGELTASPGPPAGFEGMRFTAGKGRGKGASKRKGGEGGKKT